MAGSIVKKPAQSKPQSLEGRVAELEADLARLIHLLGEQFGDPIKSKALEIIQKRAKA